MQNITEEFNTIIERIENRAMAADGPVTPTLQAATEQELSRLWQLIQEHKQFYLDWDENKAMDNYP